MALSGWSSSNYIRLSSALTTAVPVTILALFKTNSASTEQTIAGLYNSASAASRNQFRLRISSAGNLVARVGGSSSSAEASIAGVVAGQWHRGAAVFASNASRLVYLDGSSASNTTSLTPSGIDRTSIGKQDNTANDTAFDGSLAEIAFYSVALSADEIAQFTAGFSPKDIRPNALLDHVPLVRDLVSRKGSGFAMTGSLTAADHPRVLRAA